MRPLQYADDDAAQYFEIFRRAAQETVLLTVMDSKIVQVALNGLENILRLGQQDAKMNGGNNPYTVMIEQCFGRCCIT